MLNIQSHKFFDTIYPNSFKPYLLQKMDMFLALLVFLISFTVYMFTLNPSVTAGDSGELITTVYNMGASHPPGFPLYGVIGKLFTFLRFPDIGYKMNIFSGTSAAIAVLFTYLCIVKLIGFNRDIKGFSLSVHIPAFAAAILFAFSKAHWSQAIMAEVYALNAALSSILFFVMILWYQEIMAYRNEEDNLWLAPRITFLLAFVMGLSVTNHQIPVWYIIAWALMLIPILILLVSFKGENFVQQFQERYFPLILVGFVAFMCIYFLVISAIKPHLLFPELLSGEYRLVFPQHVPYILTAILFAPIFLTFYSLQNSLYKAQMYSTINRNLLEFYHVMLFIFAMGIIVYIFSLLQGVHAFFVALPLVLLMFYQLNQRKDLHKKHINNWVDNFFFILTIAMWLLVFALSVYLYMWIRAKAIAPLIEPKPLSWGDTQTIDILVNHMLRKQYPVGSDDYSNLGGQLWALVTYHISQFGIINFLLGLVGIGYFVKRDPIQGGYFILASLIYLWSIVDFINFEVDPRNLETQEVFFIQQFMIFAFFIAFAYQFFLDIPKIISNFQSKGQNND